MSIQMIAMSDFGEALMTCRLEASVMSLNKWTLLMTFLIWVQVIEDPLLVLYGIPRIFRYDLDWRSRREEMSLALMSVDSLDIVFHDFYIRC